MVVITKVFPILAVSMFSAMLGVGIIAPLLPVYAEKMGATGIWIGIIFSSFSISQVILMPVFGRLSDRVGRRIILVIGLFSYSLISLGYLWAHQVYQLVLIRLIHGVAGSMVIPIAQACIGDICPTGQEGRWMGYLNAALFAGFGSGPILGGVLTETFGIETTFYAMGGLNFIAFLLSILFLPETRRAKSAINVNRVESLKKFSAKPVLQGLFSVQLTFYMGRGMFFTFLPVLGELVVHLNPSETGTLLGANILLMSIYQVLSGRLVDKSDKKWLVIGGGIINCLFLVLIPAFDNFWHLILLFVIGSIGGALSIQSISAIAIGEGRTSGMGTILGILAMSQSIGIAAGSIFGGIMTDVVNINSVFYLASGLGILGLLLFAIRQRSR